MSIAKGLWYYALVSNRLIKDVGISPRKLLSLSRFNYNRTLGSQLCASL